MNAEPNRSTVQNARVVEIRPGETAERAPAAPIPSPEPTPTTPAPTAPPPPAAAAAPAAETPAPVQKKRPVRRILLMIAVPLILVVAGGYLWLTGGRYASTDNAYVQQDKVTVYPEIGGTISRVAVAENQAVHKGDVLFDIDTKPTTIALQQAQAAVAASRLQVEQLRAAYRSAQVALKTAQDNLAFHQSSFQRQQNLRNTGVASQAAFEQEQNNLNIAQQQVAQAKQQVESALAALGGNPDIPTDQHPMVMQALANQQKAELDVARTTVKAPADGIVSQTDRLQVGQYVTPATAVVSLFETDANWIEANFKETDLTHMLVGQKATARLDAYPDATLNCSVQSLGAGTGAEFAIIPPQNATGNWVKVVQRVPVRLTCDPSSVPFRSGLSASVEVDTGYSRIHGTAAAAPAAQPAPAGAH